MTSTPPPPEVHTPNAPLHGSLFDPSHVSNRKSDRLRSQRRAERTPSPGLQTSSFDSEGPGELKRTPKAKRNSSYLSSRSSAHHNLSPPSSPLGPDSSMAPQTRSASGKGKNQAGLAAVAAGQVGLPTPMKTPRKQILHPNSAQAARVLFPQHGLQESENGGSMTTAELTQLPTPMSKKRGKRMRKHVGFSLDDDLEHATGGQGGGIEIFTDSREMIPELDDSPENPFYARPGEPKKKYARRQLPSEEIKNAEKGIKLLEKDKGFLAVGRGRRFWKVIKKGVNDVPSSPLHDDGLREHSELVTQMDEEEGLHADPEPNADQFDRSKLRPRRLFVEEHESEEQLVDSTDDAEAVTDIEDPEKHGLPAAAPSPAKKQKGKRQTSASPEDHAITAEADSSTSKTSSAKKSVSISSSPFDDWPRRKPSRTRSSKMDSAGTKREGEPMTSAAKRIREST